MALPGDAGCDGKGKGGNATRTRKSNANRTGKTARTGRITVCFRQRQRKPHEKKFSQAAWGTREKCGRNQKEIHSNGCSLPAESNFAKAATQAAREKAANRQNYISLPPAVAQTAREKAAANRQNYMWLPPVAMQTAREKAAAQTAQEKPREQAELQFTSASGSANRTEKTARTDRITCGFRQR